MSIIRDRDRTDIDTPFRQLSFTHADAERMASQTPVHRILPNLAVLKLGGQSFLDRGKSAVFPLIEELVPLLKQHQILIGVGGGTRARHAYAVALDLGMPTQILATIGMEVPRQNARILQMLLAKHGGIVIDHDSMFKLPNYFALGCVPILPGMAPYEYWEKPAATGRIPTHRTDAGVYLTAEVLGARACLFVKDEQGLFTANPKVDRNAKFIPRIHVDELIAMNLPDLVLEPIVFDYMKDAKTVREVQVFNGLVPGNLRRALEGEHVGTIIYA